MSRNLSIRVGFFLIFFGCIVRTLDPIRVARQEAANKERTQLESEAEAVRMKGLAYKAEIERKKAIKKEFHDCERKMNAQHQDCVKAHIGNKNAAEGCGGFLRSALMVCSISYANCTRNPACDARVYGYFILDGFRPPERGH